MWLKKPTINESSSWFFYLMSSLLLVLQWKYWPVVVKLSVLCSCVGDAVFLGWMRFSNTLYNGILQRQILFDQLTLWFTCKSYGKILSYNNKTVNPPQDGLLHLKLIKLVLFVYFLYLIWTESVQYCSDECRVISCWIMKSVQSVTNQHWNFNSLQ